MTEPTYDTKLIEKMSRGNKEFVKQILLVFTEDAPKAVEQIRQGIDNNDYATMKNQAHSLKSSIDLLNINSLKNIVREIEDYASKKESVSKIKPLYLTLESHVSAVIEAIKKELTD
jgi:two-component system, sensor histidine kinase